MVWFVASTAHLTKRRAFEALLDVTSTAVFITSIFFACLAYLQFPLACLYLLIAR